MASLETQQEWTAKELGRMTAEQLDAIRHCELCLEAYENCQCRLGAPLKRKVQNSDGLREHWRQKKRDWRAKTGKH